MASASHSAASAALPLGWNRLSALRERLRSVGAKPAHERLVFRAWLKAMPLDGHRRSEFFPGSLLAALPELEGELQSFARVRSEHRGADDSLRMVMDLRDGRAVESVLLPREGVCVSSQVGCAVGCAFCMTGKGGLERQLGSLEILAQVAQARRLQPSVQKVVFMGMGEPSHNLDNVLEAIELLGTEGGFSRRNLVFSTVGDRRAFERLPLGTVKPALALSLHTTRAELRQKLLPRAPKLSPDELVELAEEYSRKSAYPIQLQWALLDGINDTDEEIEGLVRLLKGKCMILNLIPYNSVPELAFKRPPTERMVEMTRRLNRQGIRTRLRRSAGQDVDGGCGQLRARAL
ncbi:MAG: RNA methyltransferase [Bdellovibrionales bacterium]|nr:RNA methyltransferase [Bdellovibrionales bacterium]